MLLQVSKESPSGGMRMSINANQRLDVNLTMTFVELALATSRMLGAEGERVLQKARGSYAPYRIWNRTGYPLFIWSDTDGSHNVNETTAKQVANGKTIDWRFDDWKTMREVCIPDVESSLVLITITARLLEWTQ